MADATTEQISPAVDIFPSSPIGPVSQYIFSAFLEHLGRCIYGGILPSTRTTFPHTPRKPCPEKHFTETPPELPTLEGFRADVMEVLQDELRVPLVRWSGGNFVSSYKWKDGIGAQEERKRRPELAWNGEESNQFGTDEFIAWCRAAKTEPYIVLNIATGALEDALQWIEYCNGTGDTYYADLRRKHTGRDEANGVKYWGLGNEVWGEWQVGQQSATAYATKARQWAHAIRLVDPSVILVRCGETDLNYWDGIVLDELVDKIDVHSIHLYTGFGPRDRSQTEREYGRSVYGPDAAEYSIEVCKGLINKVRFGKGISRLIKIAFDEYGVWDETAGTPENGLEQFYNLADALAMASWLNVFVRQVDVVDIVCVAQSVNFISPLVSNATGLFRQTIYWPLYLFSKFSGETLPRWISSIKGFPNDLDVSAVLHIDPNIKSCSLRIAVVNQSDTASYDVQLCLAFERVGAHAEVHGLRHTDVKAQNDWEKEK